MSTVALSKQVYDILLNKILSNELPSGELINRRDIAEEFNVSVAPVMEAMLQLEMDGLLETIPRKGTRVALIRNDEISGNLLIREALESTAIRIICSNPDKTLLHSLMTLAKKIDELPCVDNYFYGTDREFHCALVAFCGCKTLAEEYERVSKLTFFYNISKFIPVGETMEYSSHVELLENLIKATPDEAQQLIHHHISSGKGGLSVSV